MALLLSDLIARGECATTEADVQRFRAAGHWQGKTIRAVLAEVAESSPQHEALVGYRSDGTVPRWTYGDLDRETTRVASGLYNLGVRPGDTVAVMLPNWIEYAALIFGINELGAIYVGIPVAYGERQVEAILRRSGASVLVVPRRWRSTEHLELSRSMRSAVPTLQYTVVLDDDAEGLRRGEIDWTTFLDVQTHPFAHVDSTAICYFGFTSGTTGEPKGAMHTHESLIYSAHQLVEHIGRTTFGESVVQLVASPTGHHTGFVWGVLFTVYVGGTGVHVDRWDPDWGVDIIRTEGVTTFFGAPTFLQDMLRTDLDGDPDCPLRCIVVAGSSVPRGLPTQAAQALGAFIAPAWGMTECSIIVSCTPDADAEVLATDGSVFDGSHAVVADADGRALPAGETGELQVRGPALFAGYYQRPDATADSFRDGWFRTGDTASMNERGWVSLRGRLKDIIIRGGENIPVTEIETVLFEHPDVLNAAVIGVPDERLGERTCAVVTLVPAAELELPALNSYLLERGLSKHYLPEQLLVLDALPMTQSGKIQKFVLRELAATEPDSAQSARHPEELADDHHR